MIDKVLQVLFSILAAGGAIAAPLATQENVGNTTSTRSSTTVFWAPHASSTAPAIASSVGSPFSASLELSAHVPSTVTIPWSPTATSSQSVHVITITSPWASATPTITVSVLQSGVTPSQPVQSSSATVDKPSISAADTATNTPFTSTVTLAPAVGTVTASPEHPVPGIVTVVDTTITVYSSSGVLTVLPTVTVTAQAMEVPQVITVKVG